MQKPCQDSYYTLFSSYPMLLDYHEEQAKNLSVSPRLSSVICLRLLQEHHRKP